MAKREFLLSLLTCGGSNMKSFSKKNDVRNTAPESNESDIIKRHEEVLILLSKFPESESESDRELSFSFLLNSSSPTKDDVSEKGSKTEDRCKEAVPVEEKRKRRINRSISGSSGRIGVLLNFHVPVPLSGNSRCRSARETPSITIEEIEKREMEFSKFGCWSALL